MAGPIESLLTEDHVRLDALLRRASDAHDEEAYLSFRKGLLRHIGMEEKILLPLARDALGEPAPMAAALRRDHAEIAALLAVRPEATVFARLRAILERHNGLEEGADGLYALCDRLAGDEAPLVAERLRAAPEVPVAAYSDSPVLRRHLGLE